MKIVSLKMAINDAGLKIQELTDKLKEKDKAVMSLARELTK
jgi:ribosome-binding protein aMBF1 (putative translation factor)